MPDDVTAAGGQIGAPIERLKALAGAEWVTPAPWRESPTDNGCAEYDLNAPTLAYRFPIFNCQSPDDLRLIVALRNALPDLIAAVEAAREHGVWFPTSPSGRKLEAALDKLYRLQGPAGGEETGNA